MNLTFRPLVAAEVVLRCLVPRLGRAYSVGELLDVIFAFEVNGYDRRHGLQLYKHRGLLFFVVAGHEGLRRNLRRALKARPAGIFWLTTDYIFRLDLLGFDFLVSFGWCHTPNFALVDPLTLFSRQ